MCYLKAIEKYQDKWWNHMIMSEIKLLDFFYFIALCQHHAIFICEANTTMIYSSASKLP